MILILSFGFVPFGYLSINYHYPLRIRRIPIKILIFQGCNQTTKAWILNRCQWLTLRRETRMSVRTYVGLITPAVSRHTTLTRGQVTGIYTGRPASNCSYSWLMHRRTHLETHTQTATPKLALETPSVALQSTRTHSRRRIMMLPTSTDSM